MVTTNYLGLYLARGLTWNTLTRFNSQVIDKRYKLLHTLLDNTLSLSLDR